LFGNEKVAEVVLAMESIHAPSTAQELARQTGIAHSMVRDVLVRLTAAGLLSPLPRIGGARSAQYYEINDADPWAHLTALARWLDEGSQSDVVQDIGAPQ
jgi:DNA-binding FadR family transcriptional regulator